MDTKLLIGTWQVINFTVRWEKTETPNGWAEFTFFEDGNLVQAVTKQGKRLLDSTNRYWRVVDKRINLYEGQMIAWRVKYLTEDSLLLSQDDDSLVYSCIRK